MKHDPQVKASIIQVAGDIAVEYLRQYPETVGKGDELPWQLENVLNCFEHAYKGLIKIVPADRAQAF